jgi:hypothetical protein
VRRAAAFAGWRVVATLSRLSLNGPFEATRMIYASFELPGRYCGDKQMLNPYIHFNGQCEEAFKVYAKVLNEIS